MNKEISDKIIKTATKKPVKSLLNPVENLLVFVVVINKDTGKVLDIVSKPSLIKTNFAGYTQISIEENDVISALRKAGYEVVKRKT